MATRFFETAIEESAADEASCAAMRSVQNRNLGDIPLIVVSAGEFAAPPNTNLSAEEKKQTMAVWAELQAELVALSSNSKQVIAEKAGHYIQVEQPEAVIDAIRQVIEIM